VGRRKIQENSLYPVKIEDLKKLDANSFIQSNPLIEAVFIQPFKELELRVLCLISKYVNANNFVQMEETEKLIKITIPKKDFCNYLNTNFKVFYLQMKGLASELTKKQIGVEGLSHSGKKAFENIVLFPRIGYKNGCAIFHISPLLQPYLQHLKSNFTKMSFDCINRIGSSHSIKIYKLLKQYENLGKRVFNVEELKHILGIEDLYQSSFKDFNKRVLLPAKKHINENTDISVSFTKNKQSKKIESISFSIKPKKTQFAQAINLFTKEIDIIVRKRITYGGYHQMLQKHWKDTKKNIEKNQFIFDLWLKKRVTNYTPSSMEALVLPAPIFSDSYKDIPEWYMEFLQNSFEVFWKGIGS
jgi:plasmid replication initiation protein